MDRKIRPLLRLLGLLALGLASLAPRCGGDAAVPEALIGRWATRAPAYAGRYFEVTETRTLILDRGDGVLQIHPIERIDSDAREDGRSSFQLHYRSDEEVELVLRLVLSPGDLPEIQIENHGERWLRAADPSDVSHNVWTP